MRRLHPPTISASVASAASAKERQSASAMWKSLIDGARICDRAIADPAGVAAAVRPLLGAHPVRQSDPRTRGLLVAVAPAISRAAQADSVPPALAALFAALAGDPAAPHILAVNETPPGPPDRFLMLPHLDRTGPDRQLPVRTVVGFLDFPEGGEGGELVVFPRNAWIACARIRSRDDAGAVAAAAGGRLVAPVPGRVCELAGDQPHAVLSYTAPAGRWRLALVLAELPAPSTSP